MALYQFGLSAGWNVSSPTNIENFASQGGHKWSPPSITPNYDRGIEKFTGDGGIAFGGYPFVPWYFGDFWGSLWYYLFNTINAGLYRGKVSIYTLTVPGLSTYSRYNAWMYLPKPAKQVTSFGIIPNYTVYMTRLVSF